MTFTLDIEIDPEQPFIVNLNPNVNNQIVTGCIVLQLTRSEKFKLAQVYLHGYVGVALNADTTPTVAYELLTEDTTDLVAANDTNGDGTICFPAGEQRLPFRIDLKKPAELPSTMTNHLDTHYISWKYEIKAVVQRSSFVSTKHSIKRELFLRRPISPAHGEEPSPAIEDAKDLPKFFRSKVTIPPRIQQGAESMKVKVEMKARNKGYMVREVECFIVQTEDINYVTKASHPKIENAENPGVPLTVNGSRTVSNVLRKQNEDADLDFGHGRPLELDIRLDNNYLIPTEQGLSWLSITHAFEYKIHFMDVNLEPVTGHWPILVDHSVVTPLRKGKNGDSVAELAPLTVQSESSDEEQSIEAESGAHAGNEDGSEDNSDVSSDTSSTHSRSSFSALSKFMDTVWSGVERRLHRQPEVVV